jgi:hypothetical protein
MNFATMGVYLKCMNVNTVVDGRSKIMDLENMFTEN